MSTEMKELIEKSQKQIKECLFRIDEIKGGAFGKLANVRVYISPEEWKEIARLEKRIEFLEKPIPNLY